MFEKHVWHVLLSYDSDANNAGTAFSHSVVVPFAVSCITVMSTHVYVSNVVAQITGFSSLQIYL